MEEKLELALADRTAFLSKLNFHFHEVSQLHNFEKQKVRKWIEKSANLLSNKKLGEIGFVFCNDSFLVEINKTYLNHNTLTDIITFNYNSVDTLNGEIYISLERVIENSYDLNIETIEELKRVIIHGILHLIGYNDKQPEDKVKMREQEDYCLTLWSEN